MNYEENLKDKILIFPGFWGRRLFPKFSMIMCSLYKSVCECVQGKILVPKFDDRNTSPILCETLAYPLFGVVTIGAARGEHGEMEKSFCWKMMLYQKALFLDTFPKIDKNSIILLNFY